jgi:hypothetical protein
VPFRGESLYERFAAPQTHIRDFAAFGAGGFGAGKQHVFVPERIGEVRRIFVAAFAAVNGISAAFAARVDARRSVFVDVRRIVFARAKTQKQRAKKYCRERFFHMTAPPFFISFYFTTFCG